MMRASVLRLSAFLQLNSFTSTNITFCRLRWLKCGINNVSTLSNSDILYHTGKLLNVHCSEGNERTFCTSMKTGQDVARYIVMRNLKRDRHSYSFWRSTSSSQHVNSDNDNSSRETITHSPRDNLERDLTSASSEDNVLDAEESSNNLPEMSRTVYNLAPYVEKSETLQNLVKLGVNLSRVEKVKGIANMLMMSEFDRDILPYLRHLVRVGVTVDKLGYILTVNPLILTEHVEHLEQRVGYLLSEDFTLDDVASMYTRAPVMILMDPVKLDKKLAFLQQAFDLTGQEVRQVALRFPKILPWKREKIAKIRFNLKEFMGFDDDELKLMVLREPKLFTADIHKVQKTFDYIHNTMQIPHSLLVKWPSSLRSRLHVVKGRHLYLVHLGRAQYDPYKENYVSLKSLIGCKDDVFCNDVAKTTVDEFHSFLKML